MKCMCLFYDGFATTAFSYDCLFYGLLILPNYIGQDLFMNIHELPTFIF